MDISIYDNYSKATRDFNFFQIDGEYKMSDSLLGILCLKGNAIFRIRLRELEVKRGSYLNWRIQNISVKSQEKPWLVD